MDELMRDDAPEASAPPRVRHRGRLILTIGAALALLLVTATAVTAATGWHFGRFSPGANTEQGPMANQAGPGGPMRGMPGLQGVVTAVDANAKTITLAGVPGVTTVTVDANVKLSAAQPDGTTKAAVIGDFAAGKIVRVHGKIDRGQATPGQRPNPANIKLTVTEIVLAQSGVTRGFGLVTAVSGGTFTVSAMGGLTLTVTPASGATLKKMDGSAFAAGDVKIGDHLMFQGAQSGNAISASDLRLVPQGAFGMGGFGRGPGGPGGPGGAGPRFAPGGRGPGGPGGPGGTKPAGTPKPSA